MELALAAQQVDCSGYVFNVEWKAECNRFQNMQCFKSGTCLISWTE